MAIICTTRANAGEYSGGGADFTEAAGHDYSDFMTATGGPILDGEQITGYTIDTAATLWTFNYTVLGNDFSGIKNGCYVKLTDDVSASYSYFYAKIVDVDDTNKTLQMSYLDWTDASGQTKLSGAEVDAALGSSTLFYTFVGGSKSSPEELIALMDVAENGLGMIEQGTYNITTNIAPNTTGDYPRIVYVVDSDGSWSDFQAILSGTSLSSGYILDMSSPTMSGWIFFNLRLTDGPSHNLVVGENGYSQYFGCRFDNAGGAGAYYSSHNTYGEFINCEFDHNTAEGVRNGYSLMLNCVSHNNGTHGFVCSQAINCVAYRNGGHGIFVPDYNYVRKFENLTLANNSGDGFRIDDGSNPTSSWVAILSGVLCYGNTGESINNLNPEDYSRLPLYDSAFDTLPISLNTYGCKQLNEDPFVDSTNDDYKLNLEGADFSDLYDSTTGQILAGALGPELTAGGGISASRIIGGV